MILLLLVETGNCYDNSQYQGRQITQGVMTRSGATRDYKIDIITILGFQWLYFNCRVSFMSVIEANHSIPVATMSVAYDYWNELLIHPEIIHITKANYRIPPTESCYQNKLM